MTKKEIENLAAAIRAVLDGLSEMVRGTDFEITGTVRSKRLGVVTYRIGHKPEGGTKK